MHEIKPLPHQQRLLLAPYAPEYQYIDFIFLIAGFGAGKSTADVYLCLLLLSKYQGIYVNFGIGGATIKHLRETLINDLISSFERYGIRYKHNSQAGTIVVGTVTFVYFSLADPDSIFGWNFSAAILDEMDELPAEDVKPGVIAVQERNRVALPDREPFIVATTTAQGLKGTYLLTLDFRKDHIPFILLRARTQDNPHLSKRLIDNLRKLYTAEEARAYLDAEFVNLTTGRVYPEYDNLKCGYTSLSPAPTDTIYVGQDFNPGFNAAVECIVRGDTIYVTACYHWEVVGDGFRQLRNTHFNTSEIIMIPDASGKEIARGYMEEAELYNIDIFWNNKNPSISERILVVNKLFRLGKLKVCVTASTEQLDRGLKTRDFDNTTGMPRKGKGPTATDHHCDALEYAVWRITHTVHAFNDLLEMLHVH